MRQISVHRYHGLFAEMIMPKPRIIWWAVALMGVLFSLRAQSAPASGLYRIISGRYSECCGIAGAFIYSLPDARQSYVQLTLDAPGSFAEMRILGEDRQTVFRTVQSAPERGFTFSLSNGMVFPDYIQFGAPFPFPMPDQAQLNYIVSNTADGLRFAGVVNTPCPGCADIPTQFKHTNVVAVFVPEPAPAIDHVERGEGSMRFHFTGPPPNDYTVEYSDSLAQPQWHSLATYRAKLATIEIVVTNSFTNASARFFRLRQEPCNCD